MRPRWSRLALAAILAFGVCPAADVAAAADDGDDAGAACPCQAGGLDAPSLAVDADHALLAAHARHGQPLCAATAPAIAPRIDLEAVTVEAPASLAEPGPRVVPWRVAPKTSPPVR